MKNWREIPERAIGSFRTRIGAADAGGCWPWRGRLQPNGYGAFTMRVTPGMHGRQVCWLAHRLSYILERGDIPDGMTLDHLCRNRGCVNPSHLEPVPLRTNLLRGESQSAKNAAKTHCVRGHQLLGSNLGVDRCRRCLTCKRDRVRKPYISIPVRCARDGTIIGHARLMEA